MENYYSTKKEESITSSTAQNGDNFDQQQYNLQYENINSTFIATHNQNDANFFNHKAFIDYYNCKSKWAGRIKYLSSYKKYLKYDWLGLNEKEKKKKINYF